MAGAQNTPGPWQAEEDDSLNGVPFIPVAGPYGDIPNGTLIAEVCASLDDATDRFHITDEDRANARLIAAAPDLLGALRFILAFYEPGQSHLDTEAWKVAEASARHAVALAEGRS